MPHAHPFRPGRRSAPRGHTLIEAMVALAIVAVLAAVALPAFGDAVRKSRRSEATAALAALQQAQERWRGNHPAYAGDLAALGIASETASGYYTVAVATVAGGYIATAHGRSGTSQAADASCRRLGVMMRGGALLYAGCGSCSALAVEDFAPTHACWAR